LFVALSGSAYAASLPRNSVGTKQLKNHAVTAAKVASGVIPHVPPIAWAAVNADATIAAKSNVKSVHSLGAGLYNVVFARRANGCAVVAAVNGNQGGTQSTGGVNTAIQLNGSVNVWTSARGLDVPDKTNEPFTIVEICL
jgi:hypothetical protein